MYKPILAAILIVTGLPLAAVSLTEGLDVIQEDEPREGIHVSEDGHRVVLTEDALPGPTGYVLLTVTAAGETDASMEADAQLNGSLRGDGGLASLWLPSWTDRPWVNVMDNRELLQASAEGHTVACCPAGSSSASGSGRMELRVGESLTVGLLAQDLPEDAHYQLALETADAPLQIARVQTGGQVAFVDLVELAYEDGANARFNEDPLVGEPGEAHRTFQADGNGLLSVESWVEGPAKAELTIELGNGTSFDNGNGRNVSLWSTGLVGDQPVDISLTDVREPSWLDQRLQAVERSTGGEDREHAWLEARVLFANLPLPGRSIDTHVDSNVEPEITVDEHTLTFTEDELEGPTGWFVARIEADQNTTVDVTKNVTITDQRPRGYLPLMIEAGHPGYAGFARVHESNPLLGVHRDGDSVTCCPDQRDELPLATPGSPGTSFDTAFIGPENPLYIGFVADGFEDDAFTIHVRPNATQGPLTDLTIADVRHGDRVHAIELVEEADHQGTNVEVVGADVVRDPGDVHRSFPIEHAALVSLDAWFEGDARGKLALTLPNGTTIDNGDGRDISTFVSGVTGPGTLSVDLTDVEQPSQTERAQNIRSFGQAHLLVADIDLPMRGLFVDQDPVEA